jgi:hypothetical protein
MSEQWMSKNHTESCWGPDKSAWRNRQTPHAIALESPGMWTVALDSTQKNLIQTCEIEAGSMKPN